MILAYPPRMMKRATAAAYLDMTVPEFEREIAAGRMPMPTRFGNVDRWSKDAIDLCAAKISGEATPSWRDGSRLYGAG